MTKPKILIQLDTDPHCSVFDAVVALDTGVEHLLPYAGVEPSGVRDLVHGAMFTRGTGDLHRTAVFIGGSDVTAGERVLAAVAETFFGPMRVSVLLDSNGANTTAAAAVLAAARHHELSNARVLVMAGTGPVGQRVARLLARQGAVVRLASRRYSRASEVCDRLSQRIPGARFEPCETADPASTAQALQTASVVIAAGSAGVELLPAEIWQAEPELKVAVDLNAVPPAGIGGVEPLDRAVSRNGVLTYGALGVGADKMRIHRAAIQCLFQQKDAVLDAEEVFDIGRQVLS